MATSETLTREDLKNVLNKVLPTGSRVTTRIVSLGLTGTPSSALLGTVTAPTIDGYTFVCWIGVASSGYIGSPYIEFQTEPSSNVWDIHYASAYNGCYVNATALYVGSVPVESSNVVVLYDNDDNTSSTTSITLSESAENFEMLTICYKTNDGDYASVSIYRPNGKTASLWGATAPTSPNIYTKQRIVKIQGTAISNINGGQAYIRGDYTQTWHGDYIAITQVIGYRTI